MATAQILTTITIDAPAQEVSLHKIDCCDFIMMIDLVRFVRIEKGAAAAFCFKNANKQWLFELFSIVFTIYYTQDFLCTLFQLGG